jgi:hypothetical protein
VHPCTFSLRCAENVIFGLLHFQRLAVIENAGTSLYRNQSGEEQGSSPDCYLPQTIAV